MLIEHHGKRPRIADSAYIAPTAVVCGDVTIGEDARVLFGAVLAAEGSPVELETRAVVLENAVVRAWPEHPVTIGNDVLIGPGAHVNGAVVGDDVFIAAGASIFPGARVGDRSIIRTNAVVHIDAALRPGSRVPVGWAAVGDPAEVLPPGEDERTLFSLFGLNFSRTVFGVPREVSGNALYAEFFGRHRDDEILEIGRA